MVDLEAMFKCVDDVRTLRQEDSEYVARFLEDAAAEIVARRREPVAQGPSVEERLDRCRTRASVAIATSWPTGSASNSARFAEVAEDLAHAMLAAERAPTYPEVKP